MTIPGNILFQVRLRVCRGEAALQHIRPSPPAKAAGQRPAGWLAGGTPSRRGGRGPWASCDPAAAPAGFTGFIPRARYLIGASYPTLAHRACDEFRRMLRKQQQETSLESCACGKSGGQAFPPLAMTYPTDRGLLPHYRGYVPGEPQAASDSLRLPAGASRACLQGLWWRLAQGQAGQQPPKRNWSPTQPLSGTGWGSTWLDPGPPRPSWAGTPGLFPPEGGASLLLLPQIPQLSMGSPSIPQPGGEFHLASVQIQPSGGQAVKNPPSPWSLSSGHLLALCLFFWEEGHLPDAPKRAPSPEGSLKRSVG